MRRPRRPRFPRDPLGTANPRCRGRRRRCAGHASRQPLRVRGDAFSCHLPTRPSRTDPRGDRRLSEQQKGAASSQRHAPRLDDIRALAPAACPGQRARLRPYLCGSRGCHHRRAPTVSTLTGRRDARARLLPHPCRVDARPLRPGRPTLRKRARLVAGSPPDATCPDPPPPGWAGTDPAACAPAGQGGGGGGAGLPGAGASAPVRHRPRGVAGGW